MTGMISTMAKGVVASYDFSPFHTIVDIGGGHGTLMIEILENFKETRGILFDMPATIEAARQRIKERGLENRCECLGGDFFKGVPAGDAMILSAVISDWDDEKSIQILSNCRRSISPQGRLLLLERLLVPEEPAPATTLLDLTMLVIGGGTGRSAMEYRHLFHEAAFEMTRVVPTGTPRSLFEAKPRV
jgi:ubiquinone/menaquinone biosynthesis C-methylase UbiE